MFRTRLLIDTLLQHSQYYVTRIQCNTILSSELEVPLESSVAQVVLFSIILRNVVEQRENVSK